MKNDLGDWTGFFLFGCLFLVFFMLASMAMFRNFGCSTSGCILYTWLIFDPIVAYIGLMAYLKVEKDLKT